MNFNAVRYFIPALFVLFPTMMSGQDQGETERVLRLPYAATDQEAQELATVARSMTDLRAVAATPAGSLTVRGAASQVALAEWLVREIDKPEGFTGAPRESAVPGSDEAVRVFNIASTATPQALQEIATVMRATADIRRLFTYAKARAVAVRGNAGQLALAEWLVNSLDRRPAETPRELRAPGTGETVRVYYLEHTAGLRDCQEVATVVRAMADIRRLFTYNPLRALVVRGTREQPEMADFLVRELDRPASEAKTNSSVFTYAPPEDTVRVLYLTRAEPLERLQQIAVQVRTATGVRRVLTYGAPRAMALRGTASQIAEAERLVRERAR